MIVRAGSTDDSSALIKLLEQLGYPLQASEVVSAIEIFSGGSYHLLVCEVGGSTVGFIALHWFYKFHSMHKTGRITAFCVDETVRSTGIGGALIKAAEDYFKDIGCRTVEVTTNLRRTRTPGFYREHGYAEQSRHFVKIL